MTHKAKIQFIINKLEELYPNPPIPLVHSDAFTLLVAVILSAQCTDKRVNLVTPNLFAVGGNPQALAQMDIAQIEKIIKTCGLYKAKARALKQMATDICNKFGGKVPSTFAELESLPGVGHKTASVIMSQAFGEPALAVDTHVHRLAERWGLSDGSSVARTERDLKAAFPKDVWSKIHLQMIYFGREFCPAKKHEAAMCPICKVISDHE